MLNWHTNKSDIETIGKIIDRYMNLCDKLKMSSCKPKRINLLMDIEACNNNGCPLKLGELLNADDFDFAHDVSGIMANINRETGKLENGFFPRYAIQG